MLCNSSMFYVWSSMKSDKKLLFGFIIHFPRNHILKRKNFFLSLRNFIRTRSFAEAPTQCAHIQNHHVINISHCCFSLCCTWWKEAKKLITQYANVWNPSRKKFFSHEKLMEKRKLFHLKANLVWNLIKQGERKSIKLSCGIDWS